MLNVFNVVLISLGFLSVSSMALAQNSGAQNLSDLKGLEGVDSHSRRRNSPSQVVILNNTPNHHQNQNQESQLNQRSKQTARQGWGTGETLELIRQQRINQESRNEQVIMEKLEESRMDDERSRLDRLFKVRQYNRMRQQQEAMIEADSRPVAIIPPQPTVVANSTAVAQVQASPVVAPSVPARTNSWSWGNFYQPGALYVKGQLGLGDYAAANNSIGVASWGLTIGKELSYRMSAELGLYKTSYEINDPNALSAPTQVRDLDQYNFTGFLNYSVLKYNQVSGFVRGGLSYVRRDSDSKDVPGLERVKSNAIDGSLGVGVEVQLGSRLSAVGQFDYYTNLMGGISSQNKKIAERVESSDYFVLGAGLKFNF